MCAVPVFVLQIAHELLLVVQLHLQVLQLLLQFGRLSKNKQVRRETWTNGQ